MTFKILVINNNRYIGTYDDNSIVKHKFYIYNCSFKSRHLMMVSVDCQCSQIKEYPTTLLPFKRYTIELEANTKNRIDFQERIANIELKELVVPISLSMRYNIKKQ